MAGPAAGVRLSFLAQVDQAKYESLFTQASQDNKYMSAASAKDVLSRSGLDSETLARIWDLSNVTQEARLTFPEFALAMYLTSMRMAGRDIPTALPDSIRQEIQSAVRSIHATDTARAVAMQPTGATAIPNIQLPTMTGFSGSAPQRSLSTSMVNSMPTGQTVQPQPTGYPALQPMMTGLQAPSSSSLQVPMITGVTPMMGNNIQVSMPTGMNSNNMAFMNRMMPGAVLGDANGQQQKFEAVSSNVKIPWAVTVEERQRYSKIFKAWDTENKGYLTGQKAKEIFMQSGLPQNVLMQIWNLADPNDHGKLNVDEFAVAMHLIYRKLNGYDVPTSLPAELIPPSTRQLNETVTEIKNSILQDVARKRGLNNFSSSPTLTPPSHGAAGRTRSVSPARKSTKEKYVDDSNDDVGYVSSARRMGPDRSRWVQTKEGESSPSGSRTTTTSSYGYRSKTTRISDLRKQIAEHKDRIKKLEEEAVARKAKPYSELSYTEQKDIDDIKDKIRELQDEIIKSGGGDDAGKLWDVYSAKTTELADITDQERSLESEVRYLIENTLRGLVRQLKETENDLAEKKKQVAKNKAAKASSMPALDIVGTGPNGEVTENDRIRAKAKAMVAARMGKITGKSANVDVTAELEAIDQEKAAFLEHADSISAFLQEMENSVEAIHMEISLIGLDIRKHEQDKKKLEERRRFELGENVAADLKAFIQQLSFEAATAKAPDVDPSFESRFPSFE